MLGGDERLQSGEVLYVFLDSAFAILESQKGQQLNKYTPATLFSFQFLLIFLICYVLLSTFIVSSVRR